MRDLNVVSLNGVAPYRGTAVRRDSIARALRAGTLVDGSVEPVGDRVRATVRLVEGTSGADVGERVSFTMPANQLLQVRDSVIQEAARLLRARLGDEVQLRELQSGTTSEEAWALVQRATMIRRDGERALAAGDAATAQTAARRADSLLAEGHAADPGWAEAPLGRGQALLLSARSTADRRQRATRLREGLSYADSALALSPDNAVALGLRGTLRYQLWRLNLDADPDRQTALLKSAQDDLDAAVTRDPRLASAHAVLSQIYYFPPHENLVSALLAAQKAYEADAYLREAENILDRLFWASHDLADFPAATQWCREGGRRFPQNYRFVECQLWLLFAPDADLDIPRAWSLAARSDSLTPVAERPLRSRWRDVLVAGVIGRAGMRDSAEHVFARARTSDPTIDPEHELMGVEAIARAQMGDDDGAIALLKRYVAMNPTHSFQRGGTLHWWWRGLERHPQFREVIRAGH